MFPARSVDKNPEFAIFIYKLNEVNKLFKDEIDIDLFRHVHCTKVDIISAKTIFPNLAVKYTKNKIKQNPSRDARRRAITLLTTTISIILKV
jgi:hypothetical protein